MKLIDKTIVLNKIKQIMHYKEREAKQFLCECLDMTLSELTLKQGITKRQYFLVYKCIILTRFGKPINKIVKRAYFYGRKFYIDNNVLAPRSETERVVDYALEEISAVQKRKGKTASVRVLDLCTGSGIIGITIKKQIEKADVTLADVSKKVLKVADINAKKLNADVTIVKSDMFANVNGKFDVIVCNPPYITLEAYKKLPKSVKNYDPKKALLGGVDGLNFYRILRDDASKYLVEGGAIVCEIGYDQKQAMQDVFGEKYADVNVYNDYEGNPRIAVIKGEKR